MSSLPLKRHWLFLCLFWVTGLQAQVPIPEDYLPSGRVGEYVQAASSFLKNSPQDRFAPRVTFDLYTLFTSIGKTKEAEQLRGKLLMDYPLSFQAGYLITTFEDWAILDTRSYWINTVSLFHISSRWSMS